MCTDVPNELTNFSAVITVQETKETQSGMHKVEILMGFYCIFSRAPSRGML